MLLYVRMAFMTILNIYMSRVILQVLGVTDYGLYEAVGGIVTMFGFLNNSMALSTQRYITYTMGKGNKVELQKIFSMCMLSHIVIAILIVLLSETLGLWFLLHKMQIPEERMSSAMIVFHCSVVYMVLLVLSVPYNAVIIAYEKMQIYAYISILEAILKLCIVYFLFVSPFDRLVVYAIMLVVLQFLIRFLYVSYCRRFDGIAITYIFEKETFLELFRFNMLSMCGHFAYVCNSQGLNILLNMFFGPLINAARGVVVQVQGALTKFSANFQMAVNPQITKSYARGDIRGVQDLLVLSSKFSYMFLFIIFLPIVYNADFILDKWLVVVPPCTQEILFFALLSTMLIPLSNPLYIIISATGKIKKYQMLEGSMLFSVLPISYLLLRFTSIAPPTLFFLNFLIELLTQCVRLKIVLPYIDMSIKTYCIRIIVPIALVSISSCMFASVFVQMVDMGYTYSVIFFIIFNVLFVLLIGYFLGCTKEERGFVRRELCHLLNKLLRKEK